MTPRDAFLQALARNEDDTTTRLVYADWLEEQGEHEEAERQRQWPAAKAWLVQFCEEHNPPVDEVDPTEEWIISYQDLLEMGQAALEEERDGEFLVLCGNNEGMSYALQDHCHEFWKNWSIVTGIPLPPDIDENTLFSCAC